MVKHGKKITSSKQYLGNLEDRLNGNVNIPIKIGGIGFET